MTAISDLIPHRPPFLLVDRVVETTAEQGITEKYLTINDPSLREGIFPDVLVVEALAQSCACMVAAHQKLTAASHRGMLVQISDFKFHERARAGETLRMVVRRGGSLGALHRFSVEAKVEDRAIAAGQLTFVVEDPGKFA